jgi:hypothetical protein
MTTSNFTSRSARTAGALVRPQRRERDRTASAGEGAARLSFAAARPHLGEQTYAAELAHAEHHAARAHAARADAARGPREGRSAWSGGAAALAAPSDTRGAL